MSRIISVLNWCLCMPWLLFWFLGVIPSFAEFDFGSDTILQGQRLRDGYFLTSENKVFQLKFFSPSVDLNSRYVGIFIRVSGSAMDDQKPVWIGNRNDPIYHTSWALMVNDTNGKLNIINGPGNVIITISNGKASTKNTSATLENDGNLVLREVYPNGSTVLWQSFDYPTDVLLPGMKLGFNFQTGHNWSLTSWISDASPSSGSFSLGVDRNKTNQMSIMWWHRSIHWTSDLLYADDSAFLNQVSRYGNAIFKFISNENEKYFTYSSSPGLEDFVAIRLTSDGELTNAMKNGILFGSCSIYSEQTRPGCVSYSYPQCINKNNNDSIFVKRSWAGYRRGIVLPIGESNVSISDCKFKCIQNCSCYAYASLYPKNGTGCQIWGLNEVNQYNMTAYDDSIPFGVQGLPVFVRDITNKEIVAAPQKSKRKSKLIWPIPTVTVAVAVAVGALLLLSLIKCRYDQKDKRVLMVQEVIDRSTHTTTHDDVIKTNKDNNMLQVHLFSFEEIDVATNNFSPTYRLGEGGFGPVYKGKLSDGQEIAVKRLAKSSSQGSLEFKNEIQLIIKLQHNNLVRLLGCCIHQEEMMLVYEFMPNKSLDFFLFDQAKRALLDWTTRMNIIEGIAQGLLYLHKHSRLKVIHRDLKASNVLLDQNMTPKISDFGMAKMFDIQDFETNTKRIVGTYGYMCPEYAINGVVSTKTDVFSFGVLVLEIVSGKKNRGSYHPDRPLNLIGLAWELWIEESVLDLVDTTMDVSNKLNEVKRCINLGLLCVQDSAADRPSMTDVLFMLKNELLLLPTPKQPAFFIASSTTAKGIEESQNQNCSNKLSTSIMDGR